MKFKDLLLHSRKSLLVTILTLLISGVYAQNFSEQKITQVSAFCTGYNTMALDTNGHIWTWGSNNNGQIGNGDKSSTNFVSTPYLLGSTEASQMVADLKFTKIANAQFTCYAIDSTGQLWGWGDNSGNQLAIATAADDQTAPVKILEGTVVVDVIPGKDFVFALDTAGKYWAWGKNTSGTLGIGTNTNVVTPVEFTPGFTIAKLVPADAHVTALDTDGNIWVWGNRTYMRLGVDPGSNQLSPLKLELTSGGNPVTFKDVAVGQYHTVAVDTNGNLWGWGGNAFGEAGGKTLTTGSTGILPEQITSDTSFVSVVCGYRYSFAYDADGNLYAFGYNAKTTDTYDYLGITGGQEFVGSSSNSYGVVTPTKVTRYNYSNITNGSLYRLYLDENGGLWAWGSNTYGMLTGTTNPVTSPMLLNNRNVPPGPANFKDQKITQVSVFNTGYTPMAIDAYGRIWTWGSNNNGQVGNGTNTTPVTDPYLLGTAGSEMVAGLAFTKVASAQFSSYAIDENGQLWGWGDNAGNQLAIATAADDQTAPVKILEGTVVVDVIPGKDFVFALDTAGKYWAWGKNTSGTLGIGTNTNVSTPVEFTPGFAVAKLVPADAHVVALDTAGNVWAWGNRTYTRLGVDPGSNQLTPLKIEITDGGSPVKFTDIANGQYQNIAVDSNGNLWAWGRDSYGELGIGSTATTETLPVKITSDTSFVSVVCGYRYSYAYDADGNLYAFGYNGKTTEVYNLLGIDGGTVFESTRDNYYGVTKPTLVSRYNYSNVSNGYLFRLYLDKDGGLWGWGSNAYGMLTGTKTVFVAPVLLNGYYTLSNDSMLATLTVNPGTLSPAFDAAVAEYMVQVPTGTTSIEVAATVSNPGAYVTGTGTIGLASADTTVLVMVTAEDGSTMTYKVNVTFATGVKDHNIANALRVYPNPTSGLLNIDGEQVKAVEVYNLSGSKMRIVMNSVNQIDVSAFSPGTYLMRITDSNDQTSVVKFIKN